jgi:hypothetical protein
VAHCAACMCALSLSNERTPRLKELVAEKQRRIVCMCFETRHVQHTLSLCAFGIQDSVAQLLNSTLRIQGLPAGKVSPGNRGFLAGAVPTTFAHISIYAWPQNAYPSYRTSCGREQQNLVFIKCRHWLEVSLSRWILCCRFCSSPRVNVNHLFIMYIIFCSHLVCT